MEAPAADERMSVPSNSLFLAHWNEARNVLWQGSTMAKITVFGHWLVIRALFKSKDTTIKYWTLAQYSKGHTVMLS